MTNIELLGKKIKQSGLKKGYIAMKLGVSPTTFSALMSNKAEFKARQIRSICEILDIQDDAEIRAIFFAQVGAFNSPRKENV